MSDAITIWLWVSCAVACAMSFWAHADHQHGPAIRAIGALVVAIIGPFFFAMFAFLHAIDFMIKRGHHG